MLRARSPDSPTPREPTCRFVATLNAARVLDVIARLLGVDHGGPRRARPRRGPGAGGLVLHPYFEGERTPNLPDATATLSGLRLARRTRGELARAAIEGHAVRPRGPGISEAPRARHVRAEGASCSSAALPAGVVVGPIAAQVSACPSSSPSRGNTSRFARRRAGRRGRRSGRARGPSGRSRRGRARRDGRR